MIIEYIFQHPSRTIKGLIFYTNVLKAYTSEPTSSPKSEMSCEKIYIWFLRFLRDLVEFK